MIIEENIVTRKLHEDWRKRIRKEFNLVDFTYASDYLSLISYIDNSPQKYYCKDSYMRFLAILETYRTQSPNLLANVLKELETYLSLANRILTEVNDNKSHEQLLPSEESECIEFVDKNIHYEILKLYETPLYCFSKIIASCAWIDNGKGLEGLDLFNAVKQLSELGFKSLNEVYIHGVRNAIAHGKISFTDHKIIYTDKKGVTELSPRDIVRIFDRALDIVNGFCSAFKVFLFTNSNFIYSYNIPIPQSVLLGELQAKANAPAWEINNFIESTIGDKKQLNIYVKNNNWDYRKVHQYSFTTAVWAENLTKSYDRFFFSMNSIHNKLSPTSWAAYDGVKLKLLRERNEKRFEEFRGVLENDSIFFSPKIKFPLFIYKLGSFYSIISNTMPIAWRDYLNTYFPSYFRLRYTTIHAKKGFTVIADPGVVINPDYIGSVEELIRDKKKQIVKQAIKYSKKQCRILSLEKLLPVKYIRVFIFDSDKRVRNLKNSGLGPTLIASIEVNTTRKIKTIDIFGGIPEQIGKYRIVWNTKWRGRNRDANTQ